MFLFWLEQLFEVTLEIDGHLNGLNHETVMLHTHLIYRPKHQNKEKHDAADH